MCQACVDEESSCSVTNTNMVVSWGPLLRGGGSVPYSDAPVLAKGWSWGRHGVHSQSPVHSDDKVDVVSGQSHRGEHNDHGDKPGLGDACCPNAGRSGCDAAWGGVERGGMGSQEVVGYMLGPCCKKEAIKLG